MSDNFRAALLRYANTPGPNIAFAGRGIVICAGGERLFTSAYVLIRVLRETLGCRLPIQLWHFGGHELSPAMRWLLAPLDVELVDATALLTDYPADIRNGWQLKPYAMLHSRFEEVLLLDADQVPVRDPASVFAMPEFRKTGAVFWPDIVDLSVSNPIWNLVGLAGETCRSWESGQIAVDKRRHLRPLKITLYLNEQAPVIYRMLYGDKDTFLIAWRVANAEAAIVPHRPFVDERVLIQRDFAGEPLFQHRTGSKWTYHTEQYSLDGFRHMESCDVFLADLRASWNGRQFFPPDRSLAACTEEERLARVGIGRLAILGDHELDLKLLAGHQIGAGRSVDRQNWYIIETGQALELIIYNGSQISYRLRKSPDGIWVGEKLSFPRSEVRLTEASDPLPDELLVDRSGLVDSVVAASGVAAGAGRVAQEQLRSTLLTLLRAHPGLRDAMTAAAATFPLIAGIVEDVLSHDAQVRKAPISSSTDVVAAGYLPPRRPRL